jgi:molecular chaperone GrpE
LANTLLKRVEKLSKMDENKELHEENLNTTEQETQQTKKKSENVTKEPTEELLAEEKDRYIRLYAEFENYKENSKRKNGICSVRQYRNDDFYVCCTR